MYSQDLDQTARHKALKKHRRAVGNKWSSVIMIPMFVMYGLVGAGLALIAYIAIMPIVRLIIR